MSDPQTGGAGDDLQAAPVAAPLNWAAPEASPLPPAPPVLPTAPAPPSGSVVVGEPSASAASTGGSGLAIASLVLGAFAALLALIPFACFAAFIPAVAGLATGIAALARRRRGKALAITGLSLSGAAIVISIAMSILTSFLIASIAEDVENSGGFDSWVDENDGSGSTPLDDILAPATVQRGTGDESITVAPYDGVGEYGYARISATGTGTFIVIGRDADGAEVERVVDVTAPFDGATLWNLSSEYEITTFEIIADGPWTVSVSSLDAVPEIDNGDTVDGSRDAVYWYGGSDTDLVLAPAGEATGYLWATSSSERWLCESDRGANCRSELPGDGGAFLQIYSDGDWTLEIGE